MRKFSLTRQRRSSLLVALPLILLFVGISLPLHTAGTQPMFAQSFDVAATVTSLVQTREAIHVLLTATAIQQGAVTTPTPTGSQGANAGAVGQNANPVLEILVAGLNVRGGPSTSSAIIGRATTGERYPIIGRSANCAWLQIARAGGATGWVSGGAQYVSYSVPCNTIPLTSP